MRVVQNRSAAAILSFVVLLGRVSVSAQAQEVVTIDISIKNHRFQPAEIRARADVPIRLQIKNLDATPAEFESAALRVEKVIAGNSDGVINLSSLKPGRYEFFDDFNKATAHGALIIQ